MSPATESPTTHSITIADLNTEVNCEPRIMDIRLAEALGFDRPRDIRPLIRRHLALLRQRGEVCPTVGRTSERGGRPAKTYWLNRKQALLICLKSETPRADEITMQVIDVYDEVTSAKAAPPPDPNAGLPRRRLTGPLPREVLQTYAAWLHHECIRAIEELNPGVPAHRQGIPMTNPGWWWHEPADGSVVPPPSIRAEAVLRLVRCPIPRSSRARSAGLARLPRRAG